MGINSVAKKMAIFDEKIEIRERCKGVHCVDLGESFPTRIYLQKSASIQPRTSPSKFEGKFNSLFTSLLSLTATSRCRALKALPHVAEHSLHSVQDLTHIHRRGHLGS